MRKKKDNPEDHVKRQWTWLPTLDFYILIEFLLYFSILLFVFITLFILGDVFNDLGDFLEHNISVARMTQYFVLKLPGNIRFVLPITMLLSCMWTMAMFGKHMEVTAMRASGLSLIRCGRPIFIIGLLVTAVNFWFNETLVPFTDREAEMLKDSYTKSVEYVQSQQRMLTYRSPDQRRTWLFNYFDMHGVQHGVTLKSFRAAPDGSLEWDIIADTARYDAGRGWTFNNVTYTPYSRDGLIPKATRKFHQIYFSPTEAPETPVDIMNKTKDEDALPTWIIWDILQKTPNMAERSKVIYQTVFWYRLAFPWSCFLAAFLGIPLATKNERSGIMLAIIAAVAIILVYYVISMGFLMLGKQGILNPFIAGMLPTIGFIIFGWYNVLRGRI